MKKILCVISIVMFVFSCKTETPKSTLPPGEYQVNIISKGTLNGVRAYIRVISTQKNKKEIIIDTAMVVNETATFTGKISSPAIRLLTMFLLC